MARRITLVFMILGILFNCESAADTQMSFDVSYQTILGRVSSINQECKQTTDFKSKISNDYDSAEAKFVSLMSKMKLENRQSLLEDLKNFMKSPLKQEFINAASYDVSSGCLNQTMMLMGGLMGRQNWAWRSEF